jgi:hypothetical protein
LFVAFFLGALLRRERHLIPLIVGGLAGVLCRPLGAAIAYGDPLFVKVQFYGFTGHQLPQNLVMYMTALLILVPGGLIFALAYRGKRWPELVSTVAVFVGMFLAYNYNASGSGGLRQWMLSLRFLIPLLPMVVFAMAHTCPRWSAALLRSRSAERKIFWNHLVHATVATWLAGVVAMGFVVNWRSDQWGKLHQDLVSALYSNTDPAQPLVADIPATIKFLNELHGPRMVAPLTGIQPRDIHALIDRYKTVQFIFFNRDDSDYWIAKSQEDQLLMAVLNSQFATVVKLEQRFPGLGVLRIWIVRARS